MKIVPFYKNEKQLIKSSILGNPDAQQRLFDKFAPKMLGVCRRYIKDVQFAEDVMINGFVKVFKSLDGFRHEGSFEGWVRTIMVRESITYLRKQQFVVYDGEVYDRMANKLVVASSELDGEHLQLLIDTLPDGYRTVFVLYAVEGYKHNEIAELLGITEGTSKSQLFKARTILKDKLRQQNIIGYGIG